MLMLFFSIKFFVKWFGIFIEFYERQMALFLIGCQFSKNYFWNVNYPNVTAHCFCFNFILTWKIKLKTCKLAARKPKFTRPEKQKRFCICLFVQCACINTIKFTCFSTLIGRANAHSKIFFFQQLTPKKFMCLVSFFPCVKTRSDWRFHRLIHIFCVCLIR